MAERISRTAAPNRDPKVRASDFDEVCLGFDENLALREASRCLNCKNPRCVTSCPVGVKIPQFISKVAEGDFTGAGEIIAQDSSLPAICGRVCPQENQCEGSCILGIKGEPVSIGQLERFVADWNREHKTLPGHKSFKPNGFKVAVIGSGPSGLACAIDLAHLGYKVTVFEALHLPGGVLQYGIPEFRLPKDTIVAKEIDDVVASGVEIVTDVLVGRTVTVDSLFEDGYDAVFVGSGAGLPRFMGIPGENLNGVYSANEFLTRNNLMKAYRSDYQTPINVGTKAVIVGGGNVAMDAARTALRLGADTTIVYRRTEKELPARREEVCHAIEEGVHFAMLTNPVEILSDGEGKVTAIRCIRMELGECDESGRRSPVPVEGSEFDIQTDTVIMALGTSPNPLIAATTPGLDTNRKGCIVTSDDVVTTRPGVFAGGDAVTGAATVILAMGAGRKAAVAIDEYCRKLR